MEEKDSKTDSDRKRRRHGSIDHEQKACSKSYWLNRFLVIVAFVVCLLIFVIMRDKLRDRHIELITWLRDNPYSGPIIIMLVTVVESLFFVSIDLLALGTGLSLQLAHEEAGKAVFVGALAMFTGFWIGTNLNAQLLKYLFREKVAALLQRYPFFSCLDKAAENHGMKIMLLLRVCPIYELNLVI